MLSYSCRYGIRAVVYLASQPVKTRLTGITQISKDLHLPAPFLAKILQVMARQGLLKSNKGPHGGFSLNKDPKKIKLIEIVRAIDGDEFFNDCVMHSGRCGGKRNHKKFCPLHKDYDKIRQDLIYLFKKRTISELVELSGTSELIQI